MSAAHDQLVPILRWLFGAHLLETEGVEMRARMLLADTVACIYAGLTAAPVMQFARDLARVEPGTFPIGNDIRLGTIGAAQALAVAAPWDEACEGHARAHGRPGVPVVAATLALGHTQGATLGAVLESIVAGYEVGARLGEWLRIKAGMHVDAGFGSFGVAAGVARLLGQGPDDALGAVLTTACQVPFGLYAPVAAGATARNTYLAHATSIGVLAAMSAHAGLDAPANALDEHARIALGLDPATARLAPAGEFMLATGYLKPFAAVRHVHYGATAALALRDSVSTRLDDITRIDLAIYEEATRYCGNRAPRTPIAAQFSLSFGIAAALRFGELRPAVYREPRFSEPGVRKLESLVRITIDPSLTAAGQRGASLTLHLGPEQQAIRVADVKGDPGDPFTPAEVRAKFVSYCQPVLGTLRAERMADALLAGPLDQPVRDLWPI